MVTQDERADYLTVGEADRRFARIDERFERVEQKRAEEKADRRVILLCAKLDEMADMLCARMAAGEESLRREKRWMFGVLFALLLAILGMVIRLSV